MSNPLFDQVDSIIARDPAARNRLEVITCYQGLHAVWLHRISHFLWNLGLKWLARVLSMFARLGEQTGQLPEMLEKAAHHLGAEVERRALNLATILEPLLIVIMGVVVLLIVLAVMLPIIQLNQWVH